jgi:hypothetical protein
MNFFSRFKKVFLIIGFLILVALIAWLIWHLFFQTTTTSVSTNQITGQNGGLPEAGFGTSSTNQATGTGSLPSGSTNGAPNPNEPSNLAVGGLTKTNTLVSSRTLAPTASKDGGIQYYNQDDNHFYRVDKNGKITSLSDKAFHNVSSVVWAPSKDQAILEYPDGSKILYNFNTKEQTTLPANWQDFSFSPDSQQIVAKSLALDPENNYLVVSNNNGSQAKTIENIGSNDKTV